MTSSRSTLRPIVRSIVIGLAVCLFAVAPIAADCGVLYLDGPPCVPCQSVVIRVVDASGPCYGYGHYEDSCTQEIIGYWFYVC